MCGGVRRHRGLSSVAGGVGSGSGQWVSLRGPQWGSFQVSWSQGRRKHPPLCPEKAWSVKLCPGPAVSAQGRGGSLRLQPRGRPCRSGLAPGGHPALLPCLPWVRLPNAPPPLRRRGRALRLRGLDLPPLRSCSPFFSAQLPAGVSAPGGRGHLCPPPQDRRQVLGNSW